MTGAWLASAPLSPSLWAESQASLQKAQGPGVLIFYCVPGPVLASDNSPGEQAARVSVPLRLTVKFGRNKHTHIQDHFQL